MSVAIDDHRQGGESDAGAELERLVKTAGQHDEHGHHEWKADEDAPAIVAKDVHAQVKHGEADGHRNQKRDDGAEQRISGKKDADERAAGADLVAGITE